MTLTEAFDNDREEIKEVLDSDRWLRIKLFEKDFWAFFQYYFPESFFFPFSDWHYEYAESLQSDQNLLVIWHRESVKTQIANVYVVWCVCIQKYHYILWGGYSRNDAQNNLYDIRSLVENNEKIKEDYWSLVFEEKNESWSKQSQKKRSVKSIHFANSVFLNSTSITTSTRWFKFVSKNRTYRPELLILDDIDVSESVENTKIIDKNYIKLRGQTFGGLPWNCKIIVLWNVISQDGLINRLEQDYKDSTRWDYYRIPSYIHDKGVCFIRWKQIDTVGRFTWDRFVKTEKEAKKLNDDYMERTGTRNRPYVSQEFLKQKDGEIWYNQNQLLLPYIKWGEIVTRSMIRHGWLTVDSRVRVVIWVDPAYSEKTKTDAVGIWITYHKTINWNKHKFVYDMLELTWSEKRLKNVVKFIANLYKQHNASLVRVEQNNGWEYLVQELRDANIACELVATTKDKVTRLIEYQSDFSNEFVWFRSDCNKEWIDQLTAFPNVKHDDMVDWMMLSFWVPEYATTSVQQYQKALQKAQRDEELHNIESNRF